MGWLLLLPLIFAFWLSITIANACAKKEKVSWRFLGMLSSFVIGGVCIIVGYWFGIEGFTEWEGLTYRQVTYPVLGWITMIGGGLIAILGTWTALVGTKNEIEQREERERLEQTKKQ